VSVDDNFQRHAGALPMTRLTPEPAKAERRSRVMTHASDASAHTIAQEEGAVAGGAWLGPAIGASILTIAWAAYLAPLLIGIFSIG
jgi:hypothetical protein